MKDIDSAYGQEPQAKLWEPVNITNMVKFENSRRKSPTGRYGKNPKTKLSTARERKQHKGLGRKINSSRPAIPVSHSEAQPSQQKRTAIINLDELLSKQKTRELPLNPLQTNDNTQNVEKIDKVQNNSYNENDNPDWVAKPFADKVTSKSKHEFNSWVQDHDIAQKSTQPTQILSRKPSVPVPE